MATQMAKRKPLSKRIRFEIFKRDGFKCRYCGRTSDEVGMEIDHVVAVASGGQDEVENLVTACVECNRGKSDKPLTVSPLEESDALFLAQQMREQERLAEFAARKNKAVAELRSQIEQFMLREGRYGLVHPRTISTMITHINRHGVAIVWPIIEQACHRCSTSDHAGAYVSATIRGKIEEGKL